MTARQRQILIALCRQHALAGRPVASRALSSVHGLDWSPATIRSELAALERLGFVAKAHAAAGRVPTAEGWRVYVEQLPRTPAPPEHRRLLDAGLESGRDARTGLRSMARVLSHLAGCVAIGFVGEPRPAQVRGLELVPLADGEGRVLVMLGFDDGASSVRTVELQREVLGTEGELRRIQGLLRELTVGRSLTEASRELRELLAVERERFDRCMAEALRVGLLLCVASFDPLWMQVAGQGSLVGPDGGVSAGPGADPQSIAELLALLEDYQQLAAILCQLLPEPAGVRVGEHRAAVRLDLGLSQLGAAGLGAGSSVGAGAGLGTGLAVGAGLSLVGCRLRWGGASEGEGPPATAAVALLGSPRMDYEAVIPLVEYAARAMAARG